ncbi:MAG TPA: hypothetical protein ENN19_04810 [Chloroflexi bacterium]|nr:hypothetical protein [Chloroflexota bacterium]
MDRQTPPTDFKSIAKAVFDDLDMQQLAIFRQLSGAQRLQQSLDLCDWARSLVIASIRSQHPGISETELTQRLRQRVSGNYAQ